MQNFPKRRQHSHGIPTSGGFTLVELLVVMAIIGILVSLLLPAVNAARDAARRTACLNNMMQIGLGLHNYEFSHEALPPGVTNPTGPILNSPEGNHLSWIVQILPYIEENTLYSMIDQKAGAYAQVNQTARQADIPSLVCPSYYYDLEGEEHAAITTYAGCHHDVEAPINDDNHGLLFLNSHIRYSDISDGSSKTILVGEMIPREQSLGWISGTRSSLRNTGTFETLDRNTPQLQRISNAVAGSTELGTLAVGGFGSFHAGGANFGFADGSTRFLSDSIDQETFHLLGNRADGQLLPNRR